MIAKSPSDRQQVTKAGSTCDRRKLRFSEIMEQRLFCVWSAAQARHYGGYGPATPNPRHALWNFQAHNGTNWMLVIVELADT